MNKIIEELIETRINGNNIKGNETYERMLKRVTYDAIVAHWNDFSMVVTGCTKFDAIDSIAKFCVKRFRK